MSEKVTLLAVFADLEPAADAIDHLRSLGIGDEALNVISGVPVTEAMLGRPRQWTNVPRLALGGSIGGFIIAVLLTFGTPKYYPVLVGGQPFIPGPPTVVVLFELTMLGMLLATFLGVFLDSYFPSYRPMEYVPEISDGKIAVFVSCAPEDVDRLKQALSSLGAEKVEIAEAQPL